MLKLFDTIRFSLYLYYRNISTKTVKLSELDQMKKMVIECICENEGAYPSYYANFIVHELIHLCDAIKNFGPVHVFWMYGFERFNKFLKSILQNKDHPHINIIRNYLVILL